MALAKKLKNSRRSPWSFVAVIVAGLIITGSGYSVATASTTDTSNGYTQAQVDSGRKLFLSNCASCHGSHAQGTDIAPTLVGVGAAAVLFQVETGRMPAAWGNGSGPQIQVKPVQFKQEDIDSLAAYVASLGDGPAAPTEDFLNNQVANGDATRGGQIFRINCAMCHNAVGAGGALTEGKYAPALTHTSAAHIYEAMVTGPQNMPVFSNSNLSLQDKADLINYLQQVQKNPSIGGFDLGNLGPVAEGLFAWIFMLGALVLITMWLGAKSN
jgi:ubiquinol-cytochrome c reductase cytochrome c subunit